MSNYERDRSRSPDQRSRGDDLQERSLRRDKKQHKRDYYPNRDQRRPRRSITQQSDDEDHEERNKRRYRDRSPRYSSHRPRQRSQSPSPRAFNRSKVSLPSQDNAFLKEQGLEGSTTEKQRPNFAPSGRLAAASNTIQTAGQSIVLKYHEPSEARKPPTRDAWRMYIFKNDEIVDTIQLYEQSCWLFGREFAVTDVAIEHPSCSKQHAVLQFRYLEKRNEFGDKIGKVKPYVLDLESSNGTFVNEEQVPEAKYFELKDKDVIRFGQSKREYVIQLPAR